MNLHLQILQAKSLPPLPLPLLFLRYQCCAVLCLGCCVLMLGHSCLSLQHVALLIRRSVCPATIRSQGGEQQSLWLHSWMCWEQLECTYQMHSACLHVPLQDFFGEKFHSAFHNICMFPPRSLDPWQCQLTLLDVACRVVWNCCPWS